MVMACREIIGAGAVQSSGRPAISSLIAMTRAPKVHGHPLTIRRLSSSSANARLDDSAMMIETVHVLR